MAMRDDWRITYWSLYSSIPIRKEAWWRLVDSIRVRRDTFKCAVCCKCSMCKNKVIRCVYVESAWNIGHCIFFIVNILLVCIYILLLNSYNLIYCRRNYGGSQRWIHEFYDVTLCFQRAYVTSHLAGRFGRLYHNLPGKVVEKCRAIYYDTVCTWTIALHMSMFCEILKDVNLHIRAIDAFSSGSRE